MPPRITAESNRPRVSDRTMVANLATTTLVRFKKTKGGVTITSMKPLGMGIRCLAAGARGPTTLNTTGTGLGGWMHESIRGRPAGGEKCLLTSPFIGLALRPARLLARPKADFCPEASTRPVTRPSRSVATTSYRQLHGWILLPLVICAVGAHH